jgi:hypothetical protein
MKILYKIVLFMLLCNLITILINMLGVFPPGSLPMSDTKQYVDDHGDITPTSVITGIMGTGSIDFSIPVLSTFFPSLTIISISYGTLVTFFTATLLIVAVITKNPQPFVIAAMVLLFANMITTSITWFNNLISNAGGVVYPSLVFIFTILGFGVLYVFLITMIESYTQGDVSDR